MPNCAAHIRRAAAKNISDTVKGDIHCCGSYTFKMQSKAAPMRAFDVYICADGGGADAFAACGGGKIRRKQYGRALAALTRRVGGGRRKRIRRSGVALRHAA